MKRLIFVLLLVTSVLLAQGAQKESLETLRYQFTQNIKIEEDDIIIQKYKNGKKNNGLAIILSAILPGMGELYADGYSSGKYFTIADGVLWGGLFGVTAYAQNQEDNYRTYAETYGGVNLPGKDDKYFADIGGYLDVYEYNHIQDLSRSSDIYNEQTDYWKWSGQDQRREYRDMWKSSETAYNTTRFIVGALILNRVASVINAVRLVNKYNNNLKTELGWDVSFNYSSTIVEPDKLSMNFRTSF